MGSVLSRVYGKNTTMYLKKCIIQKNVNDTFIQFHMVTDSYGFGQSNGDVRESFGTQIYCIPRQKIKNYFFHKKFFFINLGPLYI